LAPTQEKETLPVYKTEQEVLFAGGTRPSIPSQGGRDLFGARRPDEAAAW